MKLHSAIVLFSTPLGTGGPVMADHAAEPEDAAAGEIFLSPIAGAAAADGEQSFTLKFRHWLGGFFEHRRPGPAPGPTFYDDGALVCSSIEKRYQVLRLLGRGEFSEVKLGRCLQTGRLVRRAPARN